MVQNSNELPEGTDTIIAGASNTSDTPLGASGDAEFPGSNFSENDSLILDAGAIGSTTATSGASASSNSGSWTKKLRGGTENFSVQAGTKTRELVGQGLERGSETLANVSRMIGETAGGLDERLGEEFGDYARRAAGSIEEFADRLANKSPDELINDSREFIRKSPGVALAGAAIVGFALARLLKNGLSSSEEARAGEPGPTRSAD